MVDLNTCDKDDILIMRDGKITFYNKKLNPKADYYDHEVKYPSGGFGTRLNNGDTFTNHKFEHNDIVDILYLDPKKYLIHGT